MGPPAAGAAAGYGEECTTRLLADSTAASGVMSMFPASHGGGLLGTIAGGAPVVNPPAVFGAAAGQQQEDGFTSPELGCSTTGSGRKTRARSITRSPAPPAAPPAAPTPEHAALEGLSPVQDWRGAEEQQRAQVTPEQHQQVAAAGPFGSASAVPAFGMAAISPPLAHQQQVSEGSEPTLELAGAASQVRALGCCTHRTSLRKACVVLHSCILTV